MKFIRNILLTLFLVFILILFILWGFTHFVAKPEAVKMIAKKQLSTLTHQDSAIEGDIKWRIFPRPGLQVSQVRIGDVNRVDGDYALKVDNLTFHLRVLPLLQGHLVFDQLIFDGFTLHIHLGQTTTSNHTPAAVKNKTPTNTALHLPTHIALKSLLLTNGTVIIQEDTNKMRFNNLRLEAMLPESSNDAFPIQVKAALEEKSEALTLKGALNYKGLLTLPPLDTSNTQLENLTLDGQTTIENLHVNAYQVTTANAHTFFKNGILELNPLTLSLYNGESVGQLHYQIKSHALTVSQAGTQLNAEPIFQHIFDIHPSRFTGLLDFSFHANGALATPDWHKKMHFNGDFTIHNGTLAYLNLPAITAEATKTVHSLLSENLDHMQQALDNLKPWRLNNYSGTTLFDLVNLQYEASGNGILNYQLLLQSKKLNLKGKGTLNLSTDALNARLEAHLITKDKTTKITQQLLGDYFPLIVTGTLSNPMVHADTHFVKQMISSGGLPKSLIKPLKKLSDHIIKYAPTSVSE